MSRKIAGVVLAGGKSSRMGCDKALLEYRGRPLVEHMMDVAQKAGSGDVYISGTVQGYDGIPDEAPFQGPGRAIASLLRRFHGVYDALLFLPVDMPLLDPEALKLLIAAGGNACFRNRPLPAALRPAADAPRHDAVRDLLRALGAKEIDLPPHLEGGMANTNTKEEWEAVVSQ